jgi:hypothetical protein
MRSYRATRFSFSVLMIHSECLIAEKKTYESPNIQMPDAFTQLCVESCKHKKSTVRLS